MASEVSLNTFGVFFVLQPVQIMAMKSCQLEYREPQPEESFPGIRKKLGNFSAFVPALIGHILIVTKDTCLSWLQAVFQPRKLTLEQMENFFAPTYLPITACDDDIFLFLPRMTL